MSQCQRNSRREGPRPSDRGRVLGRLFDGVPGPMRWVLPRAMWVFVARRGAWSGSILLSLGAGSCTTTDAELILRGRACGAYGACATGFVCDDRVNLCVLPSQLAGAAGGGAGGMGAGGSDAGSTPTMSAGGTAPRDAGRAEDAAGAKVDGAASGTPVEAGIDPQTEQIDPSTGALASRHVSCGEGITCGGQDKCCASRRMTSCRLATSWCGCSTCVALMCDDFSDCPTGTICCANAQPGTRCMAPSECADALSCTETDSCLGPFTCTIESVVDGRCRGPVELVR